MSLQVLLPIFIPLRFSDLFFFFQLYQEIRNLVVMSLLHLGISPVLLGDNTDIVAGLPEETALAEEGA